MDLMEGVRRCEVKYIYVSDIDRLSRKDGSWYILMNHFTEYGVILYVSDGNKYDITNHLD